MQHNPTANPQLRYRPAPQNTPQPPQVQGQVVGQGQVQGQAQAHIALLDLSQFAEVESRFNVLAKEYQSKRAELLQLYARYSFPSHQPTNYSTIYAAAAFLIIHSPI